ncbi:MULTISPECIES: hypothetical protein [Methylobacterium]|uniref:Uncharacterized protein n=1 Tax=Methylobacterium longum TaxID=767694 RepID=A0ABT8AMR3_9HYPH|nr:MULTISPECIES: hypothetical protein [Methylobacterium]MCJ2103282.1 hypothetical protein [Methylobacterium sp. E-046]MDN3571032.1 hypothetical protein [Methylobacterium longum]GJE14168.1 hypothetical protein FOHLNKBM_5239 [Methylobacterium longum]
MAAAVAPTPGDGRDQHSRSGSRPTQATDPKFLAGIGTAEVVRPVVALLSGDLSAAIPQLGMRTETGAIASAVQVFRIGPIQMKALAVQTARVRCVVEAAGAAANEVLGTDIEVGRFAATVKQPDRPNGPLRRRTPRNRRIHAPM